MIVGKTKVGATPVAIARDFKALSQVTFKQGNLPKLAAYLDGLGGSVADALVMPELYTLAGNLVAAGDQVAVLQGSAARWYDLPFSGVRGGVAVVAADYFVGVHVGGVGANVVRFRSDGAGVGKTVADTFSDGAAATLAGASTTANDMTIYGDVFPPWVTPADLDEFTYARLPHREAQLALGATGPVRGTKVVATASWHGSTLDWERGSFMVVQAGGPLEDLVGERVKITRQAFGLLRSVYAFVHNSLTIRDAWNVPVDVSLPRRLWGELALAGDDTIQVTIERLA